MKVASLNINNFWEFKSLILAINEDYGDFVFDFRESGVFGKGINRSNTSYMEFVLMPEYFVEYKLENEMKVCIDIEELVKGINRIKKHSKVKFNIYDESSFLNVSRGQNIMLSAFTEKAEFDPPRKPGYELPEGILVKTKEFTQLVKDLGELTERCEFIIGDGKLLIRDMHMEGFIRGKRFEKDRNISKYSLSLLKPVLKAENFSDRMEVSFGNDTVMEITLKSHRPGGFVNFLTAPRLREEDEPEHSNCGECPGKEEEVCESCNGGK